MKKVITKKSAVTTATLALTTALSGCGLFGSTANVPADSAETIKMHDQEQDVKFPVAKNTGKNHQSAKDDTKTSDTRTAAPARQNTQGNAVESHNPDNAINVVSDDVWAVNSGENVTPLVVVHRNTVDDSDTSNEQDNKVVDKETNPGENTSGETNPDDNKDGDKTPEITTDPETGNEEPSVVVTPVDEENEKILVAAANLASAKTALDNANSAYDIAKQNYDAAVAALKEHTSLVGNDDWYETLKASLGQKRALLEIATASRTQAEENLETARADYATAIANASTDFENAKADADAAHETAVANAQTKYDEAVEKADENYNAIVAEADATLQTAQAAYDDAIRQINETYATAVENADSAMLETLAAAKTEQESKIADANTAYEEAIGIAQNAYNETVAEARAEYDANLKAAQDAYDEAVAALDSDAYREAKERYETAVENQKALVEAKNTADAELTSAQEELAGLETKKQEAEAAVTNAENALNAANDDVAAARAALEEANNALDTAGARNTEALTAVTQAQQAVNDAESAKEAAEAELEEAQRGTTVDNLDQLIAEAEARVAQAEQAVTDAQAQIDLGSYGFFKEQNATEAMAIIEFMQSDAIEEGRGIVLGDEKDATSLENMKVAIEMIQIGNELRVTDDSHPGLPSWKITNAMMAIAQANAEHQASTYSHWKYEDGGLGSRSGNSSWNTSENLAWGYSLPGTYTDRYGNPVEDKSAFEGWYYSEKLVYDEQTRLYELGLPCTAQDAYESLLAQGVYVDDSQIGHYVNIVSENGEFTGLAVTQNAEYGYAYAQEFTSSKINKKLMQADPTSYTIDDYYTLFMNYYNGVIEARENAEQALADARQTLADLQATESAGAVVDPEAVAAAEAKLVIAEEALETAEVVLSDARITVATTENTLEAAREAVRNGETALTNAESVKTAAEADLTSAEGALDDAEDDVADAETVVTEKENAVATAEAAVNAGAVNVSQAEAAMNAEKDALDAEISDKANALKDAENSTVVTDAETEAQETYDKAVEDAEAAKKTAVDNANAEYQSESDKAAADHETAVSDADTKRKADTKAEETKFSDAKADRDTTVENAGAIRTESVNAAETEKNDAVTEAGKTHAKTYEQLQLDFDSTTDEINQHYNTEIQNNEAAVEAAKAEETNAQTAIDETLDVIQECRDASDAVDTAEAEMNAAQEAVDAAQAAYDEAEEAYNNAVDPEGTGDVVLVFEITNS